MNKEYAKLGIIFLLAIIIFKDANALTQNERNDLINKINELKDNKEYFENLLSFLDKNFDLKNENEIVDLLKINAENLNIDLSKYPNIFGEVKREEIIKEAKNEQSYNIIKLILILIILGLIFYAMRRFIKNRSIRKQKR